MHNDWIEWTGGDCPVAKGTLVDVKYRDGVEALGVTAGTLLGDEGHVSDNGRGAYNWGSGVSSFGIVAYRLARSAHVTRMLAERDELADRMAKLHAFTVSEAYRSIAAEDQALLHEQHDAMGEYLAVLNKRIDRL